MKIKTITCHDVYNFGASLQAYALMKYLNNKGHDVEIINYKPLYLSYNLWAIGARWNKNILLRIAFYLYVVPNRLLQQKLRAKFDLFTRDYLNLTSKKYSSNEELKKNIPFADIYIAGSDQIWNTEGPNGKDLAFYLDFAPKNSVRASYAASFSIKYIVDDYREFVKKSIGKFDYLSVRESSGLLLLEQMDFNNAKLVLDPVFLLDKSSWFKIAKQFEYEKYILIYDQENNKLIKDAAIKLSKETGYKIVAIKNLYPMTYANKKIKNIGPREFLGLIRGCEILLTNSFHGSAFSILFQKEFYVFKRSHQKVNSRMVDLLNTLDIGDRIIDDLLQICSNHIDYNLVNKKLDKMRLSSYEYLNQVCS